MRICRVCGKEYEERADHQIYCCESCKVLANSHRSRVRELIRRRSKKWGFEVRNKERIMDEKVEMGLIEECPRYEGLKCICAQCIHDILEEGHCKCGLFWQ